MVASGAGTPGGLHVIAAGGAGCLAGVAAAATAAAPTNPVEVRPRVEPAAGDPGSISATSTGEDDNARFAVFAAFAGAASLSVSGIVLFLFDRTGSCALTIFFLLFPMAKAGQRVQI